jgi:hypothetical protein
MCNAEKGSLTVEEFRAVVAIREGYLRNVRDYWTFYGELPEELQRGEPLTGKRTKD